MFIQPSLRDAPPPRLRAARARGRRILVVDDCEDSANLLGRALTVCGYETRVAFDGYHAIAIADTFEPSLVMVDIGLPDMSGYELAVRLRASALRPLLLLAVTGHSVLDERGTAEARFDGHVPKPVDLEVLEREVRALLPR